MTDKTEIIERVDAPIAEIPTSNLSPMVAMAMNPDIDLDRVKQVLAIQREVKMEQAKEEFAAAFAKFQAEMPSIEKDGHVHYETAKGTTDYRHATLGNILETIRPAMGKHGLSVSWDIKEDASTITVTAELLHEGGYSRTNVMSGPADSSGGKNIIQAKGSTISYLQRYSLLSVIGAGTGIDDDGQGPDISIMADRVSDEQVDALEKLLEEKGYSKDRAVAAIRKKQLSIESIRDIPADSFDAVFAWAGRLPAKEGK